MGQPAEAIELEEVDIDTALEAAWEEHTADDEPPTDPEPSDAEPQDDEPAPVEAQGDPEDDDEPEEDLLAPAHHWPEGVKDMFNGMSRPQQDAWVDREKQFEQGYQSKAAELNNSKQAVTEFQGMISPLVQDWSRQGLTPSAGLMKLVALENDIKTDPKAALLRLAQQTGVDLNQAFQDQPYIDPQTAQLQRELREQKDEMRRFTQNQEQQAQQSQQAAKDNAFRQIEAFASTTDESGNLKYPYVQDKTVMESMGEAMRSGQAQNLHDAYEVAMGYLRSHPFFKDQVQQNSSDTQAKVSKAKSASKAVKGKTSTSSTDDNEDAALMKLLEDAGLE